MKTTRREFFQYCSISAGTLGLVATDLLHLEDVLANPAAPSVLWLQGASCSGCSVSLLNRVAPTRPYNVADLLINSINLAYHPNVSVASGSRAVQVIENTYNAGGYVLAVEGGVPTAYGGAACMPWGNTDGAVTFDRAVTALASRAAAVLSIGTCASFGGIPASGENPTGVVPVGTFLKTPTINIPGCPTHPDWIVWVVVQILLGKSIPLDADSRPLQFFSSTVHAKCPLLTTTPATTLGVANQCLRQVGCRGPRTKATCPLHKWNGGVNWCIGAGAPCLGCTEKTFPGPDPFYTL